MARLENFDRSGAYPPGPQTPTPPHITPSPLSFPPKLAFPGAGYQQQQPHYRSNIPMEIVPIDPIFHVNDHYCGTPGKTSAFGGEVVGWMLSHDGFSFTFGAVLGMNDNSGKSREDASFAENRELCGIALNPCYFLSLGSVFQRANDNLFFFHCLVASRKLSNTPKRLSASA